jgi:uncharacterized membrane protein
MSLKTYEPHKSSIGGLDANIAALLAYLVALILNFIPGAHWFTWLVPLVFFFLEKSSMLVKFHAAQAFVLGVIGAIIYIILDIISSAIAWSSVTSWLTGGWGFAGGLVATAAIGAVVGILIAIFEILAMVNAYKYKEYSIPWIGGLAEKFSAKMNKSV